MGSLTLCSFASWIVLTNMSLLSVRELPKRANAVRISKDGQTVIVGDKFGDVYAWVLQFSTH